ncbi:hypothetical protein KKG22_05660 [Patescibacteria group bacterium]|nr:hypothetical protein [Patescibacteria group bacterium]
MEAYMVHVSEVWSSEEISALRECVACLTAPWEEIRSEVLGSIAGRSLIFVGERSFSWNQIELARELVFELTQPDLRPERDVHLLFSGAIFDRLQFGEFPAVTLASMFHGSFMPQGQYGIDYWEKRTSIDHTSWHTGLQCDLVAGLVRSHAFRNVFLVLPRDHIARFAATLVGSLQTLGFANVTIIPVSYDYDQIVESETRRGERKILSMPREAFGPCTPLSDDEDPDHVNQRCGQYTERWEEGNRMWRCGKWATGPVLPSELLEYLRTYNP